MADMTSVQRRRVLKDAAEAHSDLNLFHGIVALLEGGTVSTPSHRAAEFIIRHCKHASAQALDRYDAASEKLGVKP